jgi:SM-20-related protein
MYYFSIDNFLNESENRWMLNHARTSEKDFVQSVMLPEDNSKRSSKVLYSWDSAWFERRLNAVLPAALPMLGVAPPRGKLTAQITASNDKDFLAPHPDKTELTTHVVTFVYYFHSIPKKFIGGDLVIYCGEDFEVVAPTNNKLVLFPSELWHEVLQVRCPSRQFAHSRFTVNGWFNL